MIFSGTFMNFSRLNSVKFGDDRKSRFDQIPTIVMVNNHESRGEAAWDDGDQGKILVDF